MNNAEKFISYALDIGGIELISRTLKSGRVSPYFFNTGIFNTGNFLNKLAAFYASAIAEKFQDVNVDVLFGPAYKGIPLAASTALMLWNNHRMNTGYAFNRKEAKDHGEKGMVVGHDIANKNVLIVDDVITTGRSIKEAVDVIRAHQGTPIGCLIAFDRQESGVETNLSASQNFAYRYGVPVHSISTLNDLIAVLRRTTERSAITHEAQVLREILWYKKQYGAV